MAFNYRLCGDVRGHWAGFQDSPTSAGFLALRAAVAGSPDYDPSALDLAAAEKAVESSMAAGRAGEARAVLERLMPNGLLTPWVHLLACYVYEQTSQFRSADYEVKLADTILDGIRESGDGTEDRPFLILHAADADDMLRHLDKLPSGIVPGAPPAPAPGLHRRDCEDGTRLWFSTDVAFLAADAPAPGDGVRR